LVEEFTILRIVLMVISALIIGGLVKARIDQRAGNQFFVVMILFWFAVFITAFRPEILDDIVEATGLFNKSQFLLVLSFQYLQRP